MRVAREFKTINMKKLGFFQNYRWWVWLMVALVFFFGLVGRLYDLDDPRWIFTPRASCMP